MAEFGLLLPEIYLAATVMGILVGESAHHGERVRLILPTALLGIGGALLQTLLSYRHPQAQLLGATLAFDGFGLFFKSLFLLMAGFLVAAVCLGDEIEEAVRAEFCALVLVGSVALIIAAESANLFVSAIALQGASVVGYLLAGFGRKRLGSSESAVKWLVFSSVSGAFLLLGALALYLQTGTMNIYEIHQGLVASPAGNRVELLIFAVLFLGLSAPLLIFPAQLWALDSVQGAPTPAGVYLLAGLRAGAFAVAARIWVAVFSQAALFPGKWQPLGGWDWTLWLAVSAGCSLLVPALLAMRQLDAKRLLACVGLMQGGILLLGLLVLEEVGLAAILFNLFVDLVSLSGAAYVLSLTVVRAGSADARALKGALSRRPVEALALICFVLSWLGLAPFAGGIGKFALLGAAVRREWYMLAAMGLVAITLTVVAMGRLLLNLLIPVPPLEAAGERSQGGDGILRGRKIFLLALGAPLALASVFSDALLRWASLSLRFIFW